MNEQQFEKLKKIVVDAAKANNQLQNEEEEWDNLSHFKQWLANATPLNKDVGKYAFDLMDFYCAEQLPHHHGEDGIIKLETIQPMWAQKAVREVVGEINALRVSQSVNQLPN